MREENKGRFEMLWDCPNCGTEKLLGLTHRHCPNCGSAQDPSKRYFPSDDQKVAVENHPYQGADRVCAGCDTPNAAKAGFCVNCGAPLEDSKEVRTRAVQASKSGFQGESVSDAKKEAEAARLAERQKAMGGAPSGSAAGKTGIGLMGILMAALGVVCCGGLLLFFFWKQDAALTVTGHNWERTVAVETFGPVIETAWKEQVPAAAEGVTCRPEVKDKKKVEDGEDCETKRKDKGDGTFEEVKECHPKYREEPVYADKCSYTVNKWKETSKAKAEGKALTPAPSWPSTSLSQTGECIGCQREGERKETYTVHLRDAKGGDHTCDLPEATWKGMADGSGWKSTVGVLSGSVDCGALAPAR